MELSKELNTQDNRGTAMPYFFQIKTKEMVAVPDGCGTECWHYDGSQIETEDEINEAVAEYLGQDIEYVKLISESDKESVLEKAGWSKGNYDFKENYQNAFFTEKSCKEHIRKNAYHYKEPVDYLNHAFRNPEMELVLKFLAELTGGHLHK